MMESIHICSICFEDFCDPKILPCFHTFCRDCLWAHVERVLKNGKFSCPVCRAVIGNPKNGVDGFQSNFYIIEATKAAQEIPKKEELKISLADLKSGFCATHNQEMLSLYCEECKLPCCRDCKIELHDGHNSVKLVAKANQLLDEAGELLSVIKAKTEQAHKYQIDLNVKLETVENERTRIKDDIINRKTVLEERITRKAEEALRSLIDLTKAASNNITCSLKETKTVEDKLQKITASLARTMESHDPILLLQAISEVREKVDRMTAEGMRTSINIDRLFPGMVVQMSDVALDTQIEFTIGKVMMRKCRSAIKDYLEHVTTLDSVLKDKTRYVKSILPVSDTDAWFAIRSKRESDKNTMMRKIRADGNLLVSFQIPGQINSMTSFSNGTLAVTMPKENMICVLENEHNVYQLSGVRNPMGIASYKDELFVCSVESTDLKEIRPYSVNRVIVLSNEGSVKRTIEFFDGCPLFTFPGKISMSYSGDLIVSDFAQNKIVCVGPNGKPKYEYMGRKDFVCANVFCDNTGSILVETSEGIHVLDENLKLVHRFTTDFLAEHIVAMAVCPKGRLWTVDENRRINIWRYSSE
ncbi:E3 ubiquitin-protein ligase TRIM71-like [Mercenaria mercenaria]|uniref:E3 ubiquitin-protein ligase TRIM71-like n=1 Tax=Mercenaria mercenaria TaxID=6596 RepID=UPI00234E4F90|nr:E3 ubiquitin-protein ligase TRIM71-like [Mercenaria mercenaria]